jgi:hypothetical protein
LRRQGRNVGDLDRLFGDRRFVRRTVDELLERENQESIDQKNDEHDHVEPHPLPARSRFFDMDGQRREFSRKVRRVENIVH